MRSLEGIRGVAFDLDGTLIDSAPDLALAINAMLAELSAPSLAPARIRGFIGDGIAMLVRRALRASLADEGLAQAHEEIALLRFRQLYQQHLFDRSRIYPGVSEVLGELARTGVQLCCVTNKEAELARGLLELAGLAQWFVFCLAPRSPLERKPSPLLLREAMTRLGIDPGQLLCVGDLATDVRAARAAGCPVVAVSYGYHHGAPWRQLEPDALIGDLRELLTLIVRAGGA